VWEAEESPLVEAVARKRLMETEIDLGRWSVRVVLSGVYKRSINPFTNPYPVYNHTSKICDKLVSEMQEWHGARYTVAWDQAGTILQEELLKDGHSRGDSGHVRKAAME
jgi:hypothetical protein